MDFLAQVLAWYTDPANWVGNNAIPLRLWQHLSLSAASLAVGLAIALPIGLYIGHTGRGARLTVAVTNIGRSVPSLGWLGIAFPISTGLFHRAGLGFLPAFIGLVALAIPPILTNTYVGIRGVDEDTVESARGMGMRGMQIFKRLELPLAAPVIVTGIRISAVQVVATATLAALIAGGGLGRYIVDGFAQGDRTMTTAGAILVASLAIATELIFGLAARLATPRTTSRDEEPTHGRGKEPVGA